MAEKPTRDYRWRLKPHRCPYRACRHKINTFAAQKLCFSAVGPVRVALRDARPFFLADTSAQFAINTPSRRTKTREAPWIAAARRRFRFRQRDGVPIPASELARMKAASSRRNPKCLRHKCVGPNSVRPGPAPLVPTSCHRRLPRYIGVRPVTRTAGMAVPRFGCGPAAGRVY